MNTVEVVKRRKGRLRGVIHRVRRPDRNQMEVLSQRVPLWFVCVTLFAFAAIQIMLNPFGFSDLTQRYAQDISNLLVTGPYLYGDAGQKAVSAAIIDEETLQTLQMPWPWSYGAHARVLDALLEYHPKAVVVDFLFVDTRPDPTLPQLVEEIVRYKKAGVRSISKAACTCLTANIRCGPNSHRPVCAFSIPRSPSMTASRANTM